MNLVGALRVAAAPEARGLGVLVVLNDEIQSAREVTKTSTLRLETFRSADLGMLGSPIPTGASPITPAAAMPPDTRISTLSPRDLPARQHRLLVCGADSAGRRHVRPQRHSGDRLASLAPA